MYQIKAECGMDIQVIGKGESGLCRVVDSIGQVRFTGTYSQCVQWLADRAVKVIG